MLKWSICHAFYMHILHFYFLWLSAKSMTLWWQANNYHYYWVFFCPINNQRFNKSINLLNDIRCNQQKRNIICKKEKGKNTQHSHQVYTPMQTCFKSINTILSSAILFVITVYLFLVLCNFHHLLQLLISWFCWVLFLLVFACQWIITSTVVVLVFFVPHIKLFYLAFTVVGNVHLLIFWP